MHGHNITGIVVLKVPLCKFPVQTNERESGAYEPSAAVVTDTRALSRQTEMLQLLPVRVCAVTSQECCFQCIRCATYQASEFLLDPDHLLNLALIHNCKTKPASATWCEDQPPHIIF